MPAQTDPSPDFTASDILSPQAWSGRARRPLGLDVTCTKIAIDFQNLTQQSAEPCLRENLELLREAAGCETAFIARLSEDAGSIADVIAARGAFSQCDPEALRGESLESWSWLRGRRCVMISLLPASCQPTRSSSCALECATLHVKTHPLLVRSWALIPRALWPGGWRGSFG